jgi:tetratricopeptide (TPR) repeat protein
MTLRSDLYPTIFDLALLHYRNGAFLEALSLIEETGSMGELDHALLHLAGLSAYRLKRLPEAIMLLEKALALSPEAATSWNALGEVLRQSGNHHEALRAFRKAIEIDPMMADSFSNLGNLYADVSDEESATASYRNALAIDEKHVDAWFNFGNLLFKFQRYSGALEAYQKVLELAPTHNAALNNYGALLHQLRQLDEAKEVLARLISINPRFQDGVISYARLLEDIGNDKESLIFIEESLPLISREAASRLFLVRGRVLIKSGDREGAKAAYLASLEIDPLDEEATRALINVELAGGDFISAKRRIEDLLKRLPGDLALEFARCFFELKAVYPTQDDIIAARASYETRLDEVISRLENLRTEELIGVEEVIGSAQPFLLPYQGLNDRELQKKYGEAISAVMRRVVPIPPLEKRPSLAGRKIRVGFVSGFFRNHSNYKIPIQGWLRGLHKSKFEIFCYHTQALQDECTDEARELSDRFEQGPRSVHEWARLILGDALDVVIYPEIGMDPMSCRLACLRLAPSQAASWGHPETSGIPTIDYFLSSDLMEPVDADQFYTERLVRLPNLSFSYEPPKLNSVSLSRESLGVSDEDILFWCPQTNSGHRRSRFHWRGCCQTFTARK